MVRGNANVNLPPPPLILDPSQTLGNFYYVQSSDGLSFVIVKPVISHSNYHVWACSMCRALVNKNKFDFFYGSIPIPTNFDHNFKAWIHCNMLVHSWVMNFVEDSIAQVIMFLENVVNVRHELKEHFSQEDYIRIFELQCKIFDLNQDSRTMSEFFTTLKILWE